MMRPRVSGVALVLALAMQAACAGGGTVTNTPAVSVAPVISVTPTNSASASATPTPSPLPPSSVGTIERETDVVERGRDATSLAQVATASDLFAGDYLSVRKGGEGRLDFNGGLQVRLFNDTQANIVKSQFGPGVPFEMQMALAAGGLTANLTAPGGQAQFHTPGGAVINVVGTELFVVYDSATGITLVGDFGGAVQVTGGGSTITLRPGQMITVPASLPPEQPVALALSQTAFEQAARDQKSPVAAAQAALPVVKHEPIVLTVWHQFPNNQLPAIQTVLDQYHQLHPDVTVNLAPQTDLVTALSTATAAGLPPDIVIAGNELIGQLAQANLIRPLDDYKIGTEFLDQTFSPAAAQSVVWQGKTWGLPADQTGLALVYNKNLVSPGFLPASDKDFAGLLEKAKKFQGESNRPLLCNGVGDPDPGLAAYLAAPIFFGFGVPAYVDEQRKAYLDTPEALAAAKWLVAFHNLAPAGNAEADCAKLFPAGGVGMWWTTPASIPAVVAAKINYGVTSLGRPFVSTHALMLAYGETAKAHPAATLDLMQYFAGGDAQKQLALTVHTIPAARAALADPSLSELPDVAGFGKALSRGVPFTNAPFEAVQLKPVGEGVQLLWSGKLAPDEALKVAQANLLRALDAFVPR